MERTVTIGDKTYKIGTLDAFSQFHVSRRMAPLVVGLIGAFRSMPASAPSETEGASGLDIMFLLTDTKLLDTLAEMKDEDVDYILKKCLGVVQVQVSENAWAQLMAKNGSLMYNDIGMSTMLGLTINVIQDNLGSFFPTEQPK